MNRARWRKWGAISGARCGPGPSQWRCTTRTSRSSGARATSASRSTDGVAAAHWTYSCWPLWIPATASAGVTIRITRSLGPHIAAGCESEGAFGTCRPAPPERTNERRPRGRSDRGAADRSGPGRGRCWPPPSDVAGDAPLGYESRGLGAPLEVQLGQDRADVVLDGLVREEDLGRDLLVRLSLGHQQEDLLLLLGERGQLVRERARRDAAHPFEHLLC